MARSFAETYRGLPRHVLRGFAANRLTEVAASLTFTTLLALVPLMAVGFAIVAAFPPFEGMEAELESFIFENFVPHASESVREYLATFRANVGKLSAVGIVGLGITAVMMLFTIERALNRIFRVSRTRSLVVRLLAYWALLSIGPVLFLVSLTTTSALVASADHVALVDVNLAARRLAALVPPFVTFVGFMTIYTVMPNRPVLWRHAAIGAAVAAILFETLKALFGVYVTAFPTYQTIYGTLSVLPILLVWIYLAWIVTLGGASIVAGLGEWQGASGIDLANAPRAGRLAMAVEMLRLLREAHVDGRSVPTRAFVRRIRIAPHVLDEQFATLERAGFAVATRRGAWVLGRRLDELSLYDLMLAMRLELRQPQVRGGPVPGLEDPIAAAIAAEREALDVPLVEVLDGGGATPVALAAE